MSESHQEPPSRPRPSSPGTGLRASDVFGQLQMLLALLLGILLFAVPLYLWRRPRATQVALRVDAAADAVRDAGAAPPPLADTAPASPVKLADPRVLECHDRGSRRTSPEQCDHIPTFEKAFEEAIVATHECVPADAGAGTIEYVADLSFGRRRNPVTLALPRDGRSFQSAKIAKDCAAGVKARLAGLPVAPLTHEHGRYKIALVATYAGPTPP